MNNHYKIIATMALVWLLITKILYNEIQNVNSDREIGVYGLLFIVSYLAGGILLIWNS